MASSDQTDSYRKRPPSQSADDRKRSGRQPEGPAHSREGSMLQTLKRTVTEFQEDNLIDWAAALTYYAVLSVFPALLAMVAVVGLVADPHTITKSLTSLVKSTGAAQKSAADRDST